MSPPIARRSAVARRGRLVLIGAAVALSVALSVASFEFAALMGDALGTSTATAEEGIDQIPTGAVVLTANTSAVTTATSLDDDLIARVRDIDGVLEASGTFDQPVSFRLSADEQPDRPVALRGVVFSAAMEAPWTIVTGREPVGPDEVVVDVGGGIVGQVAPGSFAELELPTGRRDVAVVGTAVRSDIDAVNGFDDTPSLSDAHVVFDPEWIGRLLGAEGRVDRITVFPEPGVDRDELAADLSAAVGTGVRVTATSDPNAVTQQTVARLDHGVQAGTQGFALLTALVAIIVVANVFAVVLAPRTQELALLRLVGATRRQLVRWLLAEALIVGSLASALGFALGVPLGSFAAGFVQTGDVEVGTTITWQMMVVAPVVGIGVTLLGALLPARRASRVSPIEALGEGSTSRRGVNRVIIGLIGGTVGTLATATTRWLPGARRVVPSMAATNVRRRPAAVAAAASTLMVGLLLVGAVAVAGASIRDGLGHRFETESTADLYLERRGVVRVDRDSLIAELNDRQVPISAATEVVSVDGTLVVGNQQENRVVAAFLESIDSVVDLGVQSGEIGGEGTMLLSGELATSLALDLGDLVTLRSTSGAEIELTLSGTYENTSFYGPAVVHIGDARSIGADGTFELLAVQLFDGVNERRAARSVERAALQFPRVRVHTPEEFVELNTAVADTVLRIVSVLLAGAVGIGAVGLSATLGLGVLERTRELSRLRAIGATRDQIENMVTLEAMLVSLGAAIVGLGVGALIGWWGLSLAPADLVTDRIVPWSVLVGVGAAAVVLGAMVSIGPARRAARMPLLVAVTT